MIIGRKRKIVNNTDIPQHEIRKIARTLYPTILEYYHSKQGQAEFKKWKEQKKLESNELNEK